MSTSRTIRFVRALAGGATAVVSPKGAVVRTGRGEEVKLGSADLKGLESAGVLSVRGDACRATPDARAWLRRALAGGDGYPSQHRLEVRRSDGTVLNLEESPLARLAAPGPNGAAAFLAPHQVEAGERVRRLAERARLQPRVTMSYSGSHRAGRQGSAVPEITDMAADARKALAVVHTILPRDCAGVVMDVCGFGKGLQTVESERGWPRRSARLVLRIGLDHLATHFGLSLAAVGTASRRDRVWLDEGARPQVL